MDAGFESRMIFPGDDWTMAEPEEQGVDSRLLDKAMMFLTGMCGEHKTDQAVVIRNGYMIWKGSDIDNRHEVWSCTKSFVSTVLGILIEDGKCTLDTIAAGYMPALKEKYPGITLRHFATMTSGYNGVGRTYDEDGSKTPFIPNEPMFSPGEKFMY